VIRWMEDTHFAAVPIATYGAILTGSAVSYIVLERSIIRVNGPDSALARAIGKEKKGKISLVLYLIAIPLAFVHPGIAVGFYVLVAAIWFVPDKRIEAILSL
jgi:TMEM175 potassium channel family protein